MASTASTNSTGTLDHPGPLGQTGEVRERATVLSKLREAPYKEDGRDKSPVAIDEDKPNEVPMSVYSQDQENRPPPPCDTSSIPYTLTLSLPGQNLE
jgi:hypothetical protein